MRLRTMPVLCLLALFPAMLNAQDYRGQIIGKILDPSGAAIPAATVTVQNIATNAGTTTKTDEAGNYTVLYLTPGQYSVNVEAQGFKKLQRQGIEVRVAINCALTFPSKWARRRKL